MLIANFRVIRPNLTMSEDDKRIIEEEVGEEGVDKVDEDTAAMPPPPEKAAIEIEKMEEQKLKSKFPGKIKVQCLYDHSSLKG